jgi:thiopeptide-type bacteriocin biosynthesis protein
MLWSMTRSPLARRGFDPVDDAMARRRNEWLQLNVSLARQDGSALPAARFILRGIEDLPKRIRAGFFFQRKPPDLRLRFFSDRESLTTQLRPLLRRARSEGHVLRHFSSIYEPEHRQFGGRECMKAVHAYWNVDSLLWIRRDRLADHGLLEHGQTALIEAVLSDLFRRVLADRGEIWDAWCNLAALVDATSNAADTAALPPPLDAVLATTSSGEADIVTGYLQANAALADGLSQAWHTGRMTCGVRSILPVIVLFTLNRHGYEQTRLARLARAMAAAWNPKQQMRGAAPDSVWRDKFPSTAAPIMPPPTANR